MREGGSEGGRDIYGRYCNFCTFEMSFYEWILYRHVLTERVARCNGLFTKNYQSGHDYFFSNLLPYFMYEHRILPCLSRYLSIMRHQSALT